MGFLGNIAFYGAIAITILALVFLTNQILAKIPGIDAIVKMVRNIEKRLGISREINLLFHTISYSFSNYCSLCFSSCFVNSIF